MSSPQPRLSAAFIMSSIYITRLPAACIMSSLQPSSLLPFSYILYPVSYHVFLFPVLSTAKTSCFLYHVLSITKTPCCLYRHYRVLSLTKTCWCLYHVLYLHYKYSQLCLSACPTSTPCLVHPRKHFFNKSSESLYKEQWAISISYYINCPNMIATLFSCCMSCTNLNIFQCQYQIFGITEGYLLFNWSW